MRAPVSFCRGDTCVSGSVFGRRQPLVACDAREHLRLCRCDGPVHTQSQQLRVAANRAQWGAQLVRQPLEHIQRGLFRCHAMLHIRRGYDQLHHRHHRKVWRRKARRQAKKNGQGRFRCTRTSAARVVHDPHFAVSASLKGSRERPPAVEILHRITTINDSARQQKFALESGHQLADVPTQKQGAAATGRALSRFMTSALLTCIAGARAVIPAQGAKPDCVATVELSSRAPQGAMRPSSLCAWEGSA